MKTLLLDLKKQEFYDEYIEIAARALRMGELVAFPTETVYGLGAHRDDAGAVARIFEVKNRPEDKRLTLMVADQDDVNKYVPCLSDAAKMLMDSFWPGALAIVFPLKDGSDISIRLPDNKIARDLMRVAKVPVVTTSANVSGKPAATDAQQVLRDFDGKIHVVLDGGSTRYNCPSTIVRFINGNVEIIRQGAISEVNIRRRLESGLVKV